MNNRARRAVTALALTLLLAADSLITRQWTLRHVDVAGSAVPAVSAAEADPMAEFRLEREQLRARLEAQLGEIIHSAEEDGESASRARAQLMDLLSRTEAETRLEGLLGARGLGEVLVSVSAREASVLVRGEGLTRAQSAQILDAVLRETGLTAGNVKIIPVK